MIAEIYSAIPVDGAGVPIARNESCNNGKKDLFRMSTNAIDDSNIFNQIIDWGYLFGTVMFSAAAATTTTTANGSVIDLYLYSLFWLLVFLISPLFVVVMSQKFLRRHGRGCRRKTNKGGSSTLGLYIKCAQFQIGILFGSMSMVPIYILFPTTPLLFLMACNYAICLVVWFFGLCLIQIFGDFEMILSCKKEDENEDDEEEDDNEYECPHNA